MSAVNYEDLYEEFLQLTSPSSTSSPSTGGDSDPSTTPRKDKQLPQESEMPEQDPVVPTEQEAQQHPHDPQRMASGSGGNTDELRKLLVGPMSQCTKGGQFRPPFPNQQFQFPPPHFMSQCTPISTTPSANIAWCHGQQTNQNSSSQQMINSYNHQQYSTSIQQHQQQQIIIHHQQQHQHQHQHQQQSQTTEKQIVQYQQQQQQIMNTINMRPSRWDNHPYPGGLNDLWRDLPSDCQKLITPEDVPESARFRGYFTVCELLILKRNLLGRYSGSVDVQEHHAEKTVAAPPVNKSKCSKRRKRSLETADEESYDETDIQANCEVTVTVGFAVKEALDTLGEEQSSTNANATPTAATSTAMIPVITTHTSTIQTVQSHVNAVQAHGSTVFANKLPLGPPPPYRTAQLVFKLLQIGNFELRSFADLTPNKLKVLFNTQRMIYECQLPVVAPQRSDMQPLRKLLTIDIGFEQISSVRFGNDKMFMKVEGPPLLTVTYNAITDDDTSSPVSEHEQELLDQIDRGQLKLSPCHQVFFINERLVHMLESQFRDHPRLRHLLFQNTGEIQHVNYNHSGSWNK